MQSTMLRWIEAADARFACERPAVVVLRRRTSLPVTIRLTRVVLGLLVFLSIGVRAPVTAGEPTRGDGARGGPVSR